MNEKGVVEGGKNGGLEVGLARPLTHEMKDELVCFGGRLPEPETIPWAPRVPFPPLIFSLLCQDASKGFGLFLVEARKLRKFF